MHRAQEGTLLTTFGQPGGSRGERSLSTWALTKLFHPFSGIRIRSVLAFHFHHTSINPTPVVFFQVSQSTGRLFMKEMRRPVEPALEPRRAGLTWPTEPAQFSQSYTRTRFFFQKKTPILFEGYDNVNNPWSILLQDASIIHFYSVIRMTDWQVNTPSHLLDTVKSVEKIHVQTHIQKVWLYEGAHQHALQCNYVFFFQKKGECYP